MTLTQRLGRLCVTAICAVAPAIGMADSSFPERNVTFVVPVPPGGPLDLFARSLAFELGQQWRVPVVVENKPGAGAALGTQAVARAASDGYTLLVANDSVASHGVLYKKPLFDVERELQPVTLIATAPFILIGSPKAPASLEELVKQGRATPGRLNVAVIPKSQQYLNTVQVLSALGVEATLIPYNGAGPIMHALLSGQVDAYLGTPAGMKQHFDRGALRPLAVTSNAPWPELPSVPTLVSQGFSPSFETWYAVLAPAGLPAPVLAKLHDDLVAAIHTPAFESSVRNAGYMPRTSSVEEFAQLVGGVLNEARELIRTHGVQLE